MATATLCSKAQLSSQEAADAVAAVALLEDLDSAGALQQLLAGRRSWAEQHLDQAVDRRTWQDAGQLLAQLSQEVQSCVAQVMRSCLCCVLLAAAAGLVADVLPDHQLDVGDAE